MIFNTSRLCDYIRANLYLLGMLLCDVIFLEDMSCVKIHFKLNFTYLSFQGFGASWSPLHVKVKSEGIRPTHLTQFPVFPHSGLTVAVNNKLAHYWII